MCVGPISMELDDVGVLQPGEVIEDHLYLVLLSFEVLALGELDLVPHHFDTFLGVHREIGAVDAWHIALFHL